MKLKRILSFFLCLTLVFLMFGCNNYASIDNTSQAFLLPVLYQGRAKIFAVNKDGVIVNKFSQTHAQPLEIADFFESYMDQGGDISFEELNYWAIGNFDGNYWSEMGVVTPGGELITPAKYTDIWQVDENTFMCSLDDMLLDFYNEEGKLLGSLRSESQLMEFEASDGMILIYLPEDGNLKIDGKSETIEAGYAYLTPGLEVVAEGFLEGNVFSEGLAPVLEDGYWGFINKDGDLVINMKYYEVTEFVSGVCAVSDVKGMTLIDKTGKTVSDAPYEDIFPMPGGMFGVRKNNNYGYYDITLLKPSGSDKYDQLLPFSNDIGIAYTTDESDMIDASFAITKDGREYKMPQYTSLISVFSEDKIVAWDELTGKTGICDMNGNWLLEPSYGKITPSGNGAVVYNSSENTLDLGRAGYIDDEFNVILKPEYSSITYFDGEYFIASNDTNSMLINKNGNIIVAFAKVPVK